MQIKNLQYGIAIALTILCHAAGRSQFNAKSSLALINRVIPDRASGFLVEGLQTKEKGDVFEIESRNNKIVLRGNNGIAVASALYYYLTHFCHCQITWNGTNLKMPKLLPRVPKKLHQVSPYPYRYYLNYCTFNYSMSWWDWKRWEKEIDWMALHGINMPLAVTGEEYTWLSVYKEMGLQKRTCNLFFAARLIFHGSGWVTWMDGEDPYR
jgi:alpha-N-acetylglucosaminidase